MTEPLDVLLVEPWYGGSHRAWADGYAATSTHDVSLLTLPAEAWKWRIRGGAATLAARVRQRPDVVLASSLLDVAAFLGHAGSALGGVPVLLYMHENQLTYPLAGEARRDTGLAFINWSSQVVADAVVFNSEYHRSTWFEAVEPFLASYPDPSHLPLMANVAAKSSVLPVGVDLDWVEGLSSAKPAPPLLVWNQRWEHDKDPGAIAAALTSLADRGVEFRAALCGEASLGHVPGELTEVADRLGARLVHFGFAERSTYRSLLGEAAVVVSAARHEFFGVAVVEAMAAGAHPVLPNRLSYPELVPAGVHGAILYEGQNQMISLLERAIAEPDPTVVARTTAAAQRFAWSDVAPRYDELIASIAAS